VVIIRPPPCKCSFSIEKTNHRACNPDVRMSGVVKQRHQRVDSPQAIENPRTQPILSSPLGTRLR